jgi:hypothetical protein
MVPAPRLAGQGGTGRGKLRGLTVRSGRAALVEHTAVPFGEHSAASRSPVVCKPAVEDATI